MVPRVLDASAEGGAATLSVDIGGRGGVVRLFLVSDAHLDSVGCRRDIWRRHMQAAVDQGAVILDGGDLGDLMNGRYDPRRDIELVRPEYRYDDYYDRVINDLTRLVLPYSDRIVFLAHGNHELAVRKNASTDPTERVAAALNVNREVPVITGGYTGWIRVRVYTGDKLRAASAFYYAHGGSGGRAPVTKGMIDTNRQAAFTTGADVVWNGHNHQAYVTVSPKEYAPARGGAPRTRLIWYVRTPGYEDTWHVNRNGFAAQRNLGPHPFGGVMMVGELNGDRLEWQAHTMFAG